RPSSNPVLKTDLAVEDVIADRGYALQAPARRNIARMKEERISDARLLEIPVNDLRDCHSRLPLLVRVRHCRQRMPMDERELAALKKHAAIGRRETSRAVGTVRNHPADRKLAGKWLALRFEVDSGSQALHLVAAGVRTAELHDH